MIYKLNSAYGKNKVLNPNFKLHVSKNYLILQNLNDSKNVKIFNVTEMGYEVQTIDEDSKKYNS